MTLLRACDCYSADCEHNPKQKPEPRIREIWSIFNGDLFDRIILRGWWIYRQECYLIRPGVVGWRDVPMFKRKRK